LTFAVRAGRAFEDSQRGAAPASCREMEAWLPISSSRTVTGGRPQDKRLANLALTGAGSREGRR
jgi:hypothetical protein